jgi:CCR4-NOT transcription complex subunit 1
VINNLADALFNSNLSNFLQVLALKQGTASQMNISDEVIASIIGRIIQDPPRNWGEEQRENLKFATLGRYSELKQRPPPIVQSTITLMDLLDSQDGRLARHVQRAGPRCTQSLEACKEVLAGVATQDIAYRPIAMTLLLMAIVENGEAYDASIFVQALRQHRAGAKIDWADVVQGFDIPKLNVTKTQFLVLYKALLPLAREYANFDIQSLWGGTWSVPETQLSFVVAFLSTTPDELDVSQIPNLRRAFLIEDFQDGSESVRTFAEQAVRHPLVSMDATEALFTMIFQSQETYNGAQMLGIPETLINPNMTVFVCAAAAVPKPWGALQDQALKQLFFPFLLKQHENYDFVMHALWRNDKIWVAGRMVEFYQSENMLIGIIYEHALEHGWLEALLTIQSSFVLELAAYAHSKGTCDLDDFAQQHVSAMGIQAFARAIVEFVRSKMEGEAIVQRERMQPASPQLQLKTAHKLLLMVNDAIPEDDFVPLLRQALQVYPRLVNYAEDDRRDMLIAVNGERGNSLPEDAGTQMEEQYKRMYGGEVDANDVIDQLKQLKISDNPADQDLFASMIHGLFDEYNCFGEYPNEALATTAVLFGGLIKYEVLFGFSMQVALYMVFEAVSIYSSEDSMWKFGMQAMLHFTDRLKDWPQLAERILHIPNLRNTQVVPAAEKVLAELRQDSVSLNGDGTNGITNGALDDEFPVDSPTPPFSSINVDAPIRPEIYEIPDEEVSDKVIFVLNNMSKRNLDEKFKDLQSALEDRHHQWFAHYLVEELAKSQPNYQTMYLQLLDNFNEKYLWAEVLRETYISCAKMLNAQSTMDSAQERTSLKNLAGWLGCLTLARNQPILHRNLSFKDLLLEANDTQRLIIAIPFTCKVLVHAAKSKIFQPPNPWLMELLGFLAELYHFMELKLNQKFEIEVLCKELNIDVNKLEPLDFIRSRPMLHENNMLQQYVPEGGPDGFGDMALMGLSKRAASERFTPEAVIQALPDLGNMLQIPTAVGNVTQPQLRSIFVQAAQQAIYEIIAPVVERSVTIAAISTAELIQKDFAAESDVEKMRNGAHTMVKSLSGSLALVTCKEPLRMSIMNNIRILASNNLPGQLPEGQILMFVNDNIDTVCSLVEQAAEEHSLSESDAQLAQAVEQRKHHNEQRPNDPFNNPPLTRWSQLIPAPFSQELGGLNRQQLALYENFGRQARLAPSSATPGVGDARGQIGDVLNDSYLPSLPTPAEVPAMPRATPQQQRMQMQVPGGQQQVNGFAEAQNIGQTIRSLLENLQQACREASEDHISDIADTSAVRRIFEELIALIDGAVQREQLALAAGQETLMRVYTDSHKRLEIEVLVRLLWSLCKLSNNALRGVTSFLATLEDDKVFNTPVTVAMMTEHLMDVEQIDMLAAKAMRQRREVALPFLNDLIVEVVLGESPVNAFRSDFTQCYEALSQWLAEDPDNDLARQIIAKLQFPSDQPNGMPSPPGSEKQDQFEYIFEEWIHLQRKHAPERAQIAFVQQLDQKHILGRVDEASHFFRSCLDMSIAAFERASSMPFASIDNSHIQTDAFARLIAVMVAYQSSYSKENAPPAKFFNAIMRLILLVFQDQYYKQGERFPSRVYFRLFSALLCEMHDLREQVGEEVHKEILQTFGTAFYSIQPSVFEGFSFGWLTLITHRLFLPAMLQSQGRTTGGWDTLLRLFGALFKFFTLASAEGEGSGTLREFYPGICRLMLMLHRDYPEFLIENHAVLNAMVPERISQLHNLINSAATHAVVAEQPDPFERGLKINRLEQVRQAPPVHTDHERMLRETNILQPVERALNGSADEISAVLAAFDNEDGQVDTLLINVLILHVGIRATASSTVFSATAPPAKFLERLLTEARPEVRFHILCALTNQLRYVNGHTQYFSTALVHMFSVESDEIRQSLMNVFVNRLSMARPHPWGLLVTMLELIKNPAYDIWNFSWIKAHPQVENMLMTLVQHQERMPHNSPLRSVA